MVRKLTHEEFMKKLEIKNKHFNDMEILSEYVNARVKIKVRCKVCGYEKEVTSSALLKGYGCAVCSGMLKKTTEQFIEEMEIKNPNIEILGEYKGGHAKIECRCKICGHEWGALPSNLSRNKNRGCPVCKVKKRTKSHKQFVKEVEEINPNIEIIGQYVNSQTKIKCKCKIDGHEWEAIPNDLVIKGSGCPKCSNHIQRTTEQFIEEMKKINSDIEILGEFINVMTKIKARCKTCGLEWEVLPYNLLRKSGCPKCSERMKKTTEQFIKEIKEINSDIKVLGEYINNRTKIKVRCKTCGHIWEATPDSLLQGCSCPHKHISKGERKVKDILSNKGVNFEWQHKFDDCKFKSYLPFDFYLPNENICIEYDGRQHYEIVQAFGGYEAFVDTKIRDTIKTQYCKDNNITLIRIPYWEFDNIENILSQIQFQN